MFHSTSSLQLLLPSQRCDGDLAGEVDKLLCDLSVPAFSGSMTTALGRFLLSYREGFEWSSVSEKTTHYFIYCTEYTCSSLNIFSHASFKYSPIKDPIPLQDV